MSPENNNNLNSTTPEPDFNPSPAVAEAVASSSAQETASMQTSVNSSPQVPVPTHDTVNAKNTPDIPQSSSELSSSASSLNNLSQSSSSTPNNFSPTSSNISAPPQSPTNSVQPKNGKFKFLIWTVIALIVIGAVAFAAFSFGKTKAKTITVNEGPVAKPINLPPEAAVTSECATGRGKQYIIPKDIPYGPIYDVENSKVIAVEYVIDIKKLLTSSDDFSSKILLLTKTYPVDHFDIVPGTIPGDTGSYIHLIMFIVPKSESQKIVCNKTTNSSQNSTTTSN